MSKNKSLFYQCKTAIDECFSKGFDKHSYKHNKEQGDQSWRIFSFSSKSNLLDTAHSLCDFIKEHYDIKQVKSITAEMCESWLSSRIESGCSISTIETYKSNLTKLSKVINHKFGVHTDFKVQIKYESVADKTSPREFALTDKEIDIIKKSITKPCNSSNFFIFSTFTSSRVNSVQSLRVSDLSFEHKNGKYVIVTNFIGDKGGRDREIRTESKEFYMFCKELTKDKSSTDLLFGGIKKDSANRWLNRRMHKLNIVIPTDRTISGKKIYKSGNHSIRKSSIQTYYNNQYNHYINKGHSEDKAKSLARGDCCTRLGHSRDRWDVIKCYLDTSK